MPGKPFFAYLAPGATHAPHHVWTEWADRYKGRFDQGWDRLREEILARQKELGVVPPDAELTARPGEIPAWDDMPEALMDTPYQWTKQVASHWGGTRNGLVVHWPAGIHATGEIRDQFHHLIDIAPTILEAARLPEPTFVHGVMQKPIEGLSMAYSFDDPAAPDRRATQYFEMMANRGIYHKGWTACTKHRTPWLTSGMSPFDEATWELYEPGDWTQARDLAADNPEKLRDLQRLWLIEATRHQVLPLDDRSVEWFLASLAGRPELVTGTSQILFGGMRRLSEGSVISVKNRSHSITAEIEADDGAASGVIIAQGGAFGGWSLYVIKGQPRYCYNLLGVRRFTVEGTQPIPGGVHQVRMEFTAEGKALGVGGAAALYLDGTPIGTGHIDATVPLIYSGDETLDIGTPVSDQYPQRGNEFTGKVRWVQIDVGEESADHLVHPEDRLRIIMARQ
jgi:Sulfatase